MHAGYTVSHFFCAQDKWIGWCARFAHLSANAVLQTDLVEKKFFLLMHCQKYRQKLHRCCIPEQSRGEYYVAQCGPRPQLQAAKAFLQQLPVKMVVPVATTIP